MCGAVCVLSSQRTVCFPLLGMRHLTGRSLNGTTSNMVSGCEDPLYVVSYAAFPVVIQKLTTSHRFKSEVYNQVVGNSILILPRWYISLHLLPYFILIRPNSIFIILASLGCCSRPSSLRPVPLPQLQCLSQSLPITSSSSHQTQLPLSLATWLLSTSWLKTTVSLHLMRTRRANHSKMLFTLTSNPSLLQLEMEMETEMDAIVARTIVVKRLPTLLHSWSLSPTTSPFTSIARKLSIVSRAWS
jgi:hypothetical protein